MDDDSLQDSRRGVPGDIRVPREDATVATAPSVASQGSAAVFQRRARRTLLEIEQAEGAINGNCNEELMRNREEATKDMAPTPATQGGHVPDIPLPDSALISNDGDSFISNTESEGGFGGANADESGSKDAFPNEGAHGPNFEKKVGLSPIIKTKFASASSCAIPKCQSYELTRA